ncbi:MAG: exopolysaccharide Pel transporter PelG [Bacillota bacterium]
MAGIGFQLKELFKEKSISNQIKAYIFSAIVSSGPWIASVITVNIILFVMNYYLKTIETQEVFLGTIVYTFVFSQIITAPWQMMITRYYSDCLFSKDYKSIKPAFLDLSRIIFILALIFSVVFYYNKPLPLYYKVMGSYLFIILSNIWILMVSLSSIKNYLIIAKAYIFGGIISILLSIYLLNNPISFSIYIYQTNILFAYLIGLTITFIILNYSFLSVFRKSNNKRLDFFRYFNIVPSLFFIGLFYTLGLWIDDIIMWISNISIEIIQTYKFAPVYDNAVFLAYLTIIPSTVLFLVDIETNLYDYYKKYYNFVAKESNLEKIEVAKDELKEVVYERLFFNFQFQLLISITIFLFSNSIFEWLNLSVLIRDIFKNVIFGALFNIFILHIILILLYFEKRKNALSIAIIFFASNTIFTLIFRNLSYEYYGLGFTIGSFLALIISIIELKRIFSKLTEKTYLSQPIFPIKNDGFFIKFVRLINVYSYSKNNK